MRIVKKRQPSIQLSADIYTLYFAGGVKLAATPNHAFVCLVDGERIFKPSNDLPIGSMVCVDAYAFLSDGSLTTSRPSVKPLANQAA